MVRRTRLLARLDAVPHDVPLILLAAPAGYGKTTALSQWAASSERPFAWVTLDAADGDPSWLAAHIALAVHDAAPVPAETVEALTTSGDTRRGGVLPRLLQLVGETQRPTVLVLDDLHEVRGRESLMLVRELVEAAPTGLHVAIAARTRPTLGLARLWTEGRCAEFGPQDLGFSQEESRQVLAAAGQRLEPETVQAVVRRTEGWPAGVYLTAMIAREDAGSLAGGSAGTIAGDDYYIADYFRDELLARESPDNVRFLLRTSVLDQMSGPLCDAVLGRTGSAARLADAERRNLFVVPLDRTGGWYRYHRLFGEMLLSELRRREPGEELALHRRAAAWYERQGRAEPAITHALTGQDQIAAARLINSCAREYIAAGRLGTVRSWLRGLDEETLVACPPAAVTAGWVWALSGDPVRAQSCLRAAREGTFDGPLPDGSASIESAVALLSAMLGSLGVDRMLDDAWTAVRLELPGRPWRPLALTALGIAHVLTGQPQLAVKELIPAEQAKQGQPVAAALARAELALLALHQGDPAADAHAAASLESVERAALQDNIAAMLTYAVSAWTAARRGEQQSARRHAGSAQRLGAHPSPAAFPWYGAQVAIALGRVSLELGDPAAARLRVEEARQHLSHLGTEGVLRQQVQDLSERLTRDGGRARMPSSMSLTAAEVRVLQLLPTHLSLAEIADELYVSRNTVKTQVAAIYRKLQADTRTAAVNRGRDLGLLAA